MDTARSKENDASHKKDGGDTKDKNPIEMMKKSLEAEEQNLLSQKDEAAIATSCSGEIESKLSSTAENDDLLDKIEEVCKDSDKQTISSTSEDISQTSDNDFLKKLEEIEGGENVANTGLIDSKVEASASTEKSLQTCTAKSIDESKDEIPSSSEDKVNIETGNKEIREESDTKEKSKSSEICEDIAAVLEKDEKTGEPTALDKIDKNVKSSLQTPVNEELTHKNDNKDKSEISGSPEIKKLPEEKTVSQIDVLPKTKDISVEKSKSEDVTSPVTGDSLESKPDKDSEVVSEEKQKIQSTEEKPESSKNIQEKCSTETPLVKADTEPMSVDASEENTMEVMEVDDDKMEVDVEDVENDEEMTPIKDDESVDQVVKEVKATENQKKDIPKKDEVVEKINSEVTPHNQGNISCIDLTDTPKKGEENNTIKIISQPTVVEIISDDDEDITAAKDVTSAKDVKTPAVEKESIANVPGELKEDTDKVSSTEKASVVNLREKDDIKVSATTEDTNINEPSNKDKEITSSSPTDEKTKKSLDQDLETTEKKTDNVTVEDLRLSDSTASLSNTSDEQLIIKFSTEHTVDLIDTDKKTIDPKLPINALKHGSSIASLNNSPVTTTTSNVFNSTPIQKQFEISSENVSKISESADHSQRDKTMNDDDEKHHNIKESETSETETCTPSESEPQSSDTVTKYIKVIKQYNGIVDDACTTTDEDDTTSKIKLQNLQKSEIQSDSFSNGDPAAKDDAKTESLYEVNVWYEETEIKYLSVERLDMKKSDGRSIDVTSSSGDTSAKGSSNGSVSSLPPFILPAARLSEISSCGSTSTSSHKTLDGKFTIPSQPKKIRHTVKGIADLCNFMIEQFGKIKQTLNIDNSTQTMHLMEPKTPERRTKEVSLSSKKNRTKDESTSPEIGETPTTSTAVASTSAQKPTGKRAPKRSLPKTNSDDDDDDDLKPKAKQSKKSQTATTKTLQDTPVKGAADDSTTTPDAKSDDTATSLSHCVLAKWVDKKFYAGKITDTKPANKFVVLFEDGASKVLPKESIVFGDIDGTLPLKDQSVHALVDDDYESGIVTDIQKVDNKIVYTVKAETSTVQITASDLYLQDDQAKIIQNLNKEADKKYVEELFKKSDASLRSATPVSSARPTRNKRVSVSPATPEAGFSGGITKKGAKRQKSLRLPTVQSLNRISESSDLSDTPESVDVPKSPDSSALEAIEGVQPELQKTPKEAEVSRMLLISDYKISDPNTDINDLLGPMPTLKTLFKNKCFLLTCTITSNRQRVMNTIEQSDEMTNRNRRFSKIPFIKNHLQKQLEAGGATVYNHFEDVPKSKYKQCKLISFRPCTTAKYVQCLSTNIGIMLHEWVIDSCRNNCLADMKRYTLPSGWSITLGQYISWNIGKSPDRRQSNQPFAKVKIIIASEHKDFVEFWSRVCKLGGATVKLVKTLTDVTPTTTGYMISEQDFPQIIQSKAEHFGIPIVSTVWIVESLILGKICDPNGHEKLKQIYQDEDI